jgi:hypothetical protein
MRHHAGSSSGAPLSSVMRVTGVGVVVSRAIAANRISTDAQPTPLRSNTIGDVSEPMRQDTIEPTLSYVRHHELAAFSGQ